MWMSQDQGSSTGEFIKFGAVVGVLIATVLIVALLRPLIFGRIVPAVMGNHLAQPIPPTQPIISAPVEPTPTAMPALEESPAETPPAAEIPVEEMPATPEPPLTHVVQRSENLTAIAAQYGVTVEALVSVNNISNPNRIEAGTVLTIPKP
jgi:nucleoid-associated protein YgaU